MEREESLDAVEISGFPCLAKISKDSEIKVPFELWKGLADAANESVLRRLGPNASTIHRLTGVNKWLVCANVTKGYVKWIGKTKDSYLVAIHTDKPVSHNQDNKFGIPKDHALLLPAEFVAANLPFVKEELMKQMSPYKMISRPHGLALVIAHTTVSNSEGAYSFLKLFEHLQYSVQHYTFSDGNQLIDLAKQIKSANHASFDSFACYVSFGQDESNCGIAEFLDIIHQCPSLNGKPKLFFVKSKLPVPPTLLHEDFFMMTALDSDNDSFEDICHDVFTQTHNDNLLSMVINSSAVKCMTGALDSAAGDCYTFTSKLQGPLNFFNKDEVFGDIGSRILEDDKLSHIRIVTRCSYVSVTGPPSSGKSLVMKMLRNEPMLINHDSSIIFRPEVKASSLVALDHNNLSRPFEELNSDLLLSAAEAKMRESNKKSTDLSVSKSLKPMKRIRRPTSYKAPAMHLVHVINSGGHPFFLDLFSHLLKHHSFNIFTHKLTEALDDEITFHCSIDGQVYPSPQNLRTTNFEYLKELARSLTDMGSHENPSLLVLGTFINELTTQDESVKTKSTELNQMLYQFKRLSQINTEDNNIFVLNALMQDREDPVARTIRQKICKSYVEEEIPIRWFLFQLELVKHQKITGECIVDIKHCIETGEMLNMKEEEVLEALQRFRDMTIFLYFPDVLPHVVFLHPQPILDKLSEISCISEPDIVKQLHHKSAVFTNAQNDLKFNGIFNRELLFQHLPNGFTDLFKAEDFLKLMNHLCIITPLSEDMLFFPKVLPEIEPMKISTSQSKVIPIVFNWKKKLIPKSLYIRLIHKLLARHSFPMFKFLTSLEPQQQYRNAFYLTNDELGGAIIIIDTMQWLEVHFTGQPQSRKCFLIKNAIFEALNDLLENPEYQSHKFNELQQCFFCEHSTSDLRHLCVLSKDGNTLTCCSDGVTIWSLNEEHKLWFSEKAIDDSLLMARALADGSVNITLTNVIMYGSPNSGKSSTMRLLLNENSSRRSHRGFHLSSNDDRDNSPTKTTMASINETNDDKVWTKTIGSAQDTSSQDSSSQDTNFVFILESGGDATFLDIAPSLMGSQCTVLFTQPLDVRFEETTTFHYNVSGQVINEPKNFRVSYLKILQETLRALYSSNIFDKNVPEAPSFAVIGTRDDLQIKLFRRALGETAKDKSDIIQSQCHHYTKMIIKYREDRGKSIFPINALCRDERELEVAGRLRQIISQSKKEFRIPTQWYKLLMKLHERSQMRDAIETKKCVQIGSEHNVDQDSVKAALKFFSDKAIFHYFPKILPDIVFLQPQMLLDKLSELVSVGFPKMASLTYKDLPVRAHEDMNKYGIFDRSLLIEFLTKDFSEFFTVDGFLALMERWSIIAPLGYNKYLLLRALPFINHSDIISLQETLTKEAATLVVTWDAPAPREIFLYTFINLLNRETCPYFKYSQQSDVKQSRNALQLQCQTEGGSLLLVDSTEWIEVSYSGPPSNCRLIRDAVNLAIMKALEKYGKKHDYRTCFFCDQHPGDEDFHLAYLNEDRQKVTCSISMAPNAASPKQKHWLKPILDYRKIIPKVSELTNILYPFATDWYEIGLNLQVSDSVLQGIQYRSMNSQSKLSLVVQEWNKICDSTSITWQAILDMVARPPINKPSLSHEIQLIAEKSAFSNDPSDDTLDTYSSQRKIRQTIRNPVSLQTIRNPVSLQTTRNPVSLQTIRNPVSLQTIQGIEHSPRTIGSPSDSPFPSRSTTIETCHDEPYHDEPLHDEPLDFITLQQQPSQLSRPSLTQQISLMQQTSSVTQDSLSPTLSTLTDKHMRALSKLIQPHVIEDLCVYLGVDDEYFTEVQKKYKKSHLVIYKMLKKWVHMKPDTDTKEELISILEDMESTEAKEWLESH